MMSSSTETFAETIVDVSEPDAKCAAKMAELEAKYAAKMAEFEEKFKTMDHDWQVKFDKLQYDAEPIIFLGYLAGADMPEPPAIPSQWHTDRNLMQRSLYSMLTVMKKKQPELCPGDFDRPLTSKIWCHMKQLVNLS